MKDINSEIEAVKLFMKEKIYFLKTSINEPNANEWADNANIIKLLQQQTQNLVEENASKNTTLKSLVKSQISDNLRSKKTKFGNHYETVMQKIIEKNPMTQQLHMIQQKAIKNLDVN